MPLALMLGVSPAGTNAASAQQFTLISAASDGTPSSGISLYPSISTDGRFVAFMSYAANLVPDDTNERTDVFVKDRVSGSIVRVSVTTSGAQSPHPSDNPYISGNGRFVLFSSQAQLAPEDTTPCVPSASCYDDLYVHDRLIATTTLVPVSSAGVQADGPSIAQDISTDGRFVLFASWATNLVAGDTNLTLDLFLRDLQNGTTTRVSLDPLGNQLATNGGLTGRMSADAGIVVYGVDNVVYQYERATGVVSTLSDTFPAANLRPGFFPAGRGLSFVSNDGRFALGNDVAFEPLDPNGVYGNRATRSLLFDRLTGRTTASPWFYASGLYPPFITGLSGDGRIFTTGGVDHPTVWTDRVSGLRESNPTSEADSSVSLSGDGRFTALSRRLPGATDAQIYVYDRDSGDGDGMPSAWETMFGLNPTNLTDANADADLDGATNLQEYTAGTHPTAVASATRYFAEGAANAFFTTRLAAVNPGDTPAAVVFRFLGSAGQTTSVPRTIAARSRITLELPENGPTPGNDFSTVIESNQLVVVDRTMTWDGTGYGTHTETALAAPSTTWHLAEGATHGAFDLFYLLQNPNGTQANVTIEYLRQAPLTPVSKTYTVEPNSRRTIPVDGEGPDLEAVDVAASITSDLPIVVERAMYSTRPGQPAFAAGHGAAAVPAPALRWFLAEGATGSFFDLYVLVGNPNTSASALKVTYLLPDGAPFEKTYAVGPKQRLTIYVQDEDARLANTPVSVIVESTNDQPVVVERAMWWPKGEWHEAHVSAGATTTGTKWALADGEVTAGGDTYILIANMSTTAGTAIITLLEEGGTPMPITVDLQPSSRLNVAVSQYLPPTAEAPRRRFGALIETSGIEIVVERSIYATAGGITWGAGTAALGTKLQ